MRLLYLYINSYRCFRQKHPLEINFTTNFRFHLEQDSSPNIILAYEKTSDKLPDNFFSVDSTDDVVTEVSAIMGENGGGKTTIASFLQRSRMVDAKKNKFVIVYEKEETRKWVVLSTMGTIVVSPQNPQPKSGYTWSIDENVGYLPVEEILKMDFDYVYYSPHYTTQYAFSLHDDPSCANLSTTALFSKRPDYYYNKNCSRRDSISFILEYPHLLKMLPSPWRALRDFRSLKGFCSVFSSIHFESHPESSSNSICKSPFRSLAQFRPLHLP